MRSQIEPASALSNLPAKLGFRPIRFFRVCSGSRLFLIFSIPISRVHFVSLIPYALRPVCSREYILFRIGVFWNFLLATSSPSLILLWDARYRANRSFFPFLLMDIR